MVTFTIIEKKSFLGLRGRQGENLWRGAVGTIYSDVNFVGMVDSDLTYTLLFQ